MKKGLGLYEATYVCIFITTRAFAYIFYGSLSSRLGYSSFKLFNEY